jgi:hypothetical protein
MTKKLALVRDDAALSCVNPFWGTAIDGNAEQTMA